MKKNFLSLVLFLVLITTPVLINAQISGQNPLMVTNKNNGTQIGVGKIPVEMGDTLARFQMRGWVSDGYYHPGFDIKAYVTGPVMSDGFPADLRISTGYPNLLSRMVVTAIGNVGIGTNNPDPNFRLHTVGNTHTTGDFFGRLHFDDNGSADAAPSTYIDEAYFEFHNRTAFNDFDPTGATDDGGLFTLAPGGASDDHQLFFGDEGIFHRQAPGAGANWPNDWNKLITSADIMGTPNRIAKFLTPNSIGDSQLFDDGTRVGLRTTTPSANFDVDVMGNTRLNGRVSINTDYNNNSFALAVDGNVICEEVRVILSQFWPDYVFDVNYELMPLEEVEAEIAEKGHLPGIPSAQEIESQGLDLGDITVGQQEKIEEVFLYLIKMEKELKELKQENASLRQKVDQLEKVVNE